MIRNKKKYFFLILIQIIFFNSCQRRSEKKEFKAKNNIKKNIEKVIITGASDDAKFFKYFNLLGVKSTMKFKSKDSISIMASLEKTKFVNLVAFGDTLINTYVFMSPGDSIHLEVKDKEVKFKGENAAYYNFFLKLDSLQFKQSVYSGNLENYKKSCLDNFNKKRAFSEQYFVKNKNLSKDFKYLIEGWIQFEYYNNLLFQTKQDGTPIYISDLKTKFKNEEEYSSYFDTVSVKNFNKPKLLEIAPFYSALSNYIRYYFTDSDLEEYSSEKFIQERDFILNNLSDEIQSFAISRIIFDYYNNNRLENKKNIKSLIANYKRNFTDINLIKNIEKIEKRLKSINRELSPYALNSKLLSLQGDTVSFKDVIKKQKGKINTIDFWASWCSPCIQEIKKGKEVRIRMTREDDVEWTYLSIDDNVDKWKKKSKELEEYGLLKNQYLILDHKKSALIKNLNVTGIPRYIILNKNGQIVDGDAPRPSNTIVFKKIIDNINIQK